MLNRMVFIGPSKFVKPGNKYWKWHELKSCVVKFHAAKWLRIMTRIILLGSLSSMAVTAALRRSDRLLENSLDMSGEFHIHCWMLWMFVSYFLFKKTLYLLFFKFWGLVRIPDKSSSPLLSSISFLAFLLDDSVCFREAFSAFFNSRFFCLNKIKMKNRSKRDPRTIWYILAIL